MPLSGRNERGDALHPQCRQPRGAHIPQDETWAPYRIRPHRPPHQGGAVTLARELQERRARSRSNSPSIADQEPG